MNTTHEWFATTRSVAPTEAGEQLVRRLAPVSVETDKVTGWARSHSARQWCINIQ